jgi:hypothetical protein
MPIMGTTSLAIGATALTGCSLLYNPGNLPAAAIDAGIPIDAPTLVDRDKLGLTGAGPHVLFEGQGTGGSRAAILVIMGHDIADDAVVSLVPVGATGPGPLIEIDNDHAVRSLSGTSIAVPVTLPIDTSRGLGDVTLTIQIAQMGLTQPVMAPLADQVTLHNLPELDALAAGAVPAGLYSRVKIAGNLTFAAKAGASPIVFRAVSSIELADVHVDASGTTPGVAGVAGGAAQNPGFGPGGGKPGTLVTLQLNLLVAASGGGFGTAGMAGNTGTGGTNPGGPSAGDELLRSLVTNTSSGGGGGGSNPGGGSGGAIEITAGGTLKAGTITANGGKGGSDGLLSAAAGGGSGGAIILRSGAAATLAKVIADGGVGGDHPTTGSIAAGSGGGGRLRHDVPAFAGTPVLPMAHLRGATFETAAGANPLITTEAQQAFTIDGAVSAIAANNLYDLYVLSAAQATTYMVPLSFGTPSVVVKPMLTPGYNQICVTPHGLNPLTDLGSTNCIDTAYVP